MKTLLTFADLTNFKPVTDAEWNNIVRKGDREMLAKFDKTNKVIEVILIKMQSFPTSRMRFEFTTPEMYEKLVALNFPIEVVKIYNANVMYGTEISDAEYLLGNTKKYGKNKQYTKIGGLLNENALMIHTQKGQTHGALLIQQLDK